MRIGVVILAGGEGSRIGGDKPLRLLAGKSLLDRAIDQARCWSDRVAVAVRNDEQLTGSSVPIILDDPDIEGPLGGLAAALSHGEGLEAVLTIPADMPFLPADLRIRLQSALTGTAAAIACSGKRLHPVCGLWAPDSFDRLRPYVRSGRRSLKGFAEAVGFVAVDWQAEPFDPFFNVNNPEDLADAEQYLQR